MELSALAARLRRLEDLEALRRLKADYCELCDRGAAGSEIAALFTEDAELALLPDGGRARGHADIAAFYARLDGRFARGAHLLANPRLEVEGDRATGRWWMLLLAEDTRAEPPAERRLLAEYREHYQRVDGAWRISRLAVHGARWLEGRA